jgi:hypothetical protein
MDGFRRTTDGDLGGTSRTLARMTSPKVVSRWSLTHTGNRVFLAVALGVIAYATSGGSLGLAAVIAVLTYVIATLFAKPRS